ncbi:ankyrin repeat domain-containing protein [uncultured Desulfobacter sp.]|uniref:ankyrin repeat domain-containing protein n=1 Tax=uncultured Desulfobacter sp. TaxID=240139 RepID=UPI0029C96E00|nr:ankyrin repeat domain-containing protein [uncultured Desulfobacter sp.]
MFYIKLYRALIVTFTNALLIVLFTTQCIAGQTIEPVLRGKDPLPDALKGPGIESLDALGDTPANEKMKSESEIQGMFLQALGMDDAVQALYLISKGAQVNLPLSDTGATALMLAQSLSMVRMLVSKGADINTQDNQNGTALHYAVTRPAAKKIVPFLVKSGADINARGWENETPFNIAIGYLNETRTKDLEILKLLAELGADINAPDNNGYTGLHKIW